MAPVLDLFRDLAVERAALAEIRARYDLDTVDDICRTDGCSMRFEMILFVAERLDTILGIVADDLAALTRASQPVSGGPV